MESTKKISEEAALLLCRYPPKKDNTLRGCPSAMYDRRFDAFTFHRLRYGGKCSLENKICVSASGGVLHGDAWQEDLYGFTRIVVHGVDSICVAARTEDLEPVMCQARDAARYMCALILKNALIYEAEDLALPLGEAGKMTCRSFEKPFVAVSLAPDTNNGDEASSDEYDVDSAIGFFKEAINHGTTFTFDESVETAISTLEYLFGKRFDSKEIKVFYVRNHSGRVDGGTASSEAANEFPVCAKRSIMDHLAVIEELPCGEGSSSSGCF